MNNTKVKPVAQAAAINPSFYNFGEIDSMDIPEPDYLVYGLGRGEVGMLQSVTNIGKTTLLMNLSLCLCSGRPYLNISTGNEPLRVLYMDYETSLGKSRQDFRTMWEWFDDEEKQRVRDNLMLYNLNSSRSDDIRLGDVGGWARTLQAAKSFKPDIIIVDVVSLAFPGVRENDNTDITTDIMDRLGTLGREVNAGVLFAHHIGKEKSEEGRTSFGPYRSRGGSAFAGASKIIYQLENKVDTGIPQVWFSVEKVKDDKPAPIQLELDRESRWFHQVGSTISVPVDTRMDTIVALVEAAGKIKKGELWKMAKSFIGSDSTLERFLKKGIAEGLLESPQLGWYKIPSTSSDRIEGVMREEK